MAGRQCARVGGHCVACGCCVKVCPMGALSVWKGVIARVDRSRCVGCGKCVKECPAETITLAAREEAAV